jgi:non-specific serine/threonine protein kinase
MGVVFRYRDTKLDRLVAVKTIPMEYTRSAKWRERFDVEAKMVAALDHPNIAKIYDVAEHEGVDFLILEYVPGETLAHRLQSDPLPVEQALHICLQIGEAIAAGHARGVVHRDIKPGNVMITPDDVAKVLDYGLAWQQRTIVDARTIVVDESPGSPMDPRAAGDVARLLDELATADTHEPGRPTPPPRRREVVGTPGYMSPEQIRGESTVDEGTDVWAFGCVLYECLTGHHAFPGRSDRAANEAALYDEPEWKRLPSAVPRRVIRLMRTCLAKDPAERRVDLGRACRELRPGPDEATTTRLRVPVPRSLPTQLTSFVGREGEMERLGALLDNCRLLTITGIGGTGKTRLAGELAAAKLARDGVDDDPRFGDGVWFVKLAPLTEADQVPQTVASLIFGEDGLKPVAEQPLRETLLEALSARHLLLVLDNCEHIGRGCSELVIEMLARCPHLVVVATSREPLGVPGELTYRVPELSIPPPQPTGNLLRYESARLFVDRAVLARPSFGLDERNQGAVAEICRRLEGMPLAIELAAARVGSVPVEAVAKRLFEVLDPSAVLESSIAWSVQHLRPAERSLMGRVCVFRGGWTLEAVETVCADGDDRSIDGSPVIDRLSQLVDKSLVRYEEHDDRARYHILETVREYCRRHLVDADAGDAVRRRHFDLFHGLAMEAHSHIADDEHAAWLDRLEIEHDNLRAAVEYGQRDDVDASLGAELAWALHAFWYIRGYLEEGRAALDFALERRAGTVDLLQAQVANAAGIIADRLGEAAVARACYEQALVAVREIGDPRRVAGVLTNLGIVCQDLGELDESRAFHREAMAGYEAIGDTVGVAMVQLNLGDVAILGESYEEARELHEASLPVFRETGDVQRIAGTLDNLGLIAHHQGDDAQAMAYFRKSLAVRRELKEGPATANTLIWLAILLQKRGHHELTARLLGAGEVLVEGARATVVACDRVLYEQTSAAAREALGDERFAAAWNGGRTLTIDEAVALALGDERASDS